MTRPKTKTVFKSPTGPSPARPGAFLVSLWALLHTAGFPAPLTASCSGPPYGAGRRGSGRSGQPLSALRMPLFLDV